ncbi:hypothetical protein DE146DRAFT_773219 [Phaeosphaeria sp. MPI-PUGE-AT-0046c]|nr:hypothetical protein DE146DRAFT_773219 [Phaeosphaeria sp. MPI-PUGE-AT-0046c]
MPYWFTPSSAKRSATDTGKSSSPRTQNPSPQQQPPAPRSHHADSSQHTQGPGPASTPQPQRHRTISPLGNNDTSRTGSDYRSISPLGTSRFEQPSPYTHARIQHVQQSSRSRHVCEVPRLGCDGYYGASDTTVLFEGAGVGRRNAKRGRGEGEKGKGETGYGKGKR